ncbi:P-type conjugative transfer protein TrbL [Brevundimonas diminuta]|uniref:P-type conjugative transfer protein TrbL n=2 Tax=Brevundimonas diminuta TaxID=293 RepID=A0A1Z3LVV2_BREDI|nr:P-type conjugative transfer protein TrbL [Brevundimonas diminuta]
MDTPNELMVVFSNTVTAGFDALSGSVNGVFGLLIALVVALTGIQWALSPNREVLASGFGKVLLIGAFAWIINDWQALSETIYAGFLELGLTAGGGSLSREEFLNPGAILQQGWEIVKALGETPAPVENPLDVMGNMADALILGLAMIGIMLAFAILALQIIVSLLEFKIVTLGGFVLLPFGIWNKTAFLAERPLGYVVSSGLKVLALAIVVSGARTIFDQLQPSANPDIYEALTILVAALLLAMLAIFIPNLASALVTGGPALGAGAALTSGLAVAGAGALVAGGVAGAGAMAGRAAAIGGSSRSAAGAASAARPSGGGPSSGGAPSGGGPRPSPGPGPGSGPAGRTRDPAHSAGDAAPTSGAAAAPSSPTPAPSEAPPPQPDSSGPPPGKAGPQAETRSRASLSEDRPLGGGAKGGRATGRSAALQAFFIANSGRALMPAGENSGALKPTVRSED